MSPFESAMRSPDPYLRPLQIKMHCSQVLVPLDTDINCISNSDFVDGYG